jgi:hypothetical protein
MTESDAIDTVTTEIWVNDAQYYLNDLDDSSQALGSLSGSGLLVLLPGLAAVYCGTNLGPLRITVQVRQTAPPLDLAAWEDVAEASFTAPNGQAMIEEAGGPAHQELPNLTPAGPGAYRLRLHVRGRDQGWEEDTPEEPVEEHLLAIWPAPPAPEVIHKLTSQHGQAEAARAVQTLQLRPTAEPASQPPSAAGPPGDPIVTTAVAGIAPTAEPSEPAESPRPPDEQPPQQHNHS